IRKASDLQGQTTSGAVVPSQVAAAAAFRETERREAFVGDLLDKLNIRRDLGIRGFEAIEAIESRPPPGAFYFYVRLRDVSEPALDVAERLLAEASVACIPGEPFDSPGHLRFNFAVEEAVLEEGLQRISDFFS
ncbi:MAG: aminotransferase class I/II-fold pyridoxal phosphate-dependent enzyme, partial [Gemmatimonadetes bacterium]|nr:aminotransferase class I/II-fold pyridoxal phosphate-dependent enzyme [Gemmatimonadota bacterium]